MILLVHASEMQAIFILPIGPSLPRLQSYFVHYSSTLSDTFPAQYVFKMGVLIYCSCLLPNLFNLRLLSCAFIAFAYFITICRDILELGSSMPWQDILELTLGTREIEVTPLMEYFQPLITWLKKENEAAGDDVGWEGSCDHGMA